MGAPVVVDAGVVVVALAAVVVSPAVVLVSPVVVGGTESRLQTATMATMAMSSTIKMTSGPRDMASGYDSGVARVRNTQRSRMILPIASRS